MEFLDAALELIGLMETRMTCFLEPLDSLLRVLRSESPLMKNAAGDSFFAAWRSVFSAERSGVRESDRRILLAFGDSLGDTDIDGQKALCESARERLRAALENAREEKQRFARLGALLPVFAGAAVIILLI